MGNPGMRVRHPPLLAACIVGCELVGMAGGLFTAAAIPSWYAQLNKASFSPPPWAFGPAWLALYLLMGIALYLVLERGTRRSGVRLGVALFSLQLAANFLWSLIFFGMRSILGGLVDIIVMALLIAATTLQFYGVRRAAAFVMLPYLAWTLFALSLNYYALLLNP